MDLTPRQIALLIALFAIAATGYAGYLAYESRNATPFDRNSDQYNGWIYAESNQLKDVRECEDKDGGWADLGIETTAEFIAGCDEWFRSH